MTIRPNKLAIIWPGAALLVLLACLGGCLHPDRWPFSDADYNKKIPEQDYRSFQVPAELKPVLAKPAKLPGQVGDNLELSVEQAVMLALGNNLDLSAHQYNPAIAKTFEQIERGVYDTELLAEISQLEEKTRESSRSSGNQYDVDSTERNISLGLRQKLPTGTTLELSASQYRETSNRTPEEQDARLGLSFTQSLLRGLGPVVNLVAVRQAELGSQASIYQLRGFTEAMLAETEIAYWQLVQAEREMDIVKRSLEVARQQLANIEERISVGVLPKVEAAAARSEVARREQALIEAGGNIRDRRLRLLKLINPSGRLDLKVTGTSQPAIHANPIRDLAGRIELAERSRPDLNEAKLRWKQNRLETITTKNGLLPKLELFATLGQTGYADSFGRSVNRLDDPYTDFAAGLRFSHFLDNRSARARHSAALATARQASAAVDNLRQLVGLDVRLAANQVEVARRQISATRLTRELEEQTVAAEKERFEVGKSTTLLVAQAQRDLLASQINEVRAILSYRIALVKLFLAEGSLLERRGVVMAKSISTD